MFNLSLLTADIWAVVFRFFFYQQQVFISATLSYTIFFFLGTTEIFFHSFLYNGIVQSIHDPMVPSYAGRLVILSCFRNCGFWTHHLFNKVCSNPYHV